MIQLTRLGQQQPFFLNPDLIERIDANADSVIRLTNGVEYVVAESADEIVDRIIEFRLSTVASGPVIARSRDDKNPKRPPTTDPRPEHHDEHSAVVVELPSQREESR